MKEAKGARWLNSLEQASFKYCDLVRCFANIVTGVLKHQLQYGRGAVAHPGERFNGIEEVASSSLASSTNHLTLLTYILRRFFQ